LRKFLARLWRWAREQFAPDHRRPLSRAADPALARELERVHSLAARRAQEPIQPLDPRDLPEPASASAAVDEALPFGDFSGADEAERFAALPPIGPEAVDDVDWDALARELTRRA
jgi:hypothetical protein